MVVCIPLAFLPAGRPCHFCGKERIALDVLILNEDEVFDAMILSWCLSQVFRERKWWTFVRSTLSVSDRQADAEPISLICVCGSSKAVLAPSLTPLQEKQAKILIMTAKAVTGHIFPQEQHRNKKNLKRKTCAIPLVSCCFLQTVTPCSHLQLSLDSQFCNIST